MLTWGGVYVIWLVVLGVNRPVFDRFCLDKMLSDPTDGQNMVKSLGKLALSGPRYIMHGMACAGSGSSKRFGRQPAEATIKCNPGNELHKFLIMILKLLYCN